MSNTLKDKIHLMIDLETLGIETDSVIVSIGIAAFDIDTGIKFSRQWILSTNEQLKMGRTINASTLAWWFQQSEEARKDVISSLNDDGTVSVETFMCEFFELLGVKFSNTGYPIYNPNLIVWAHGPHFDISKIDHLCGSVEGGVSPWKYNSVRDTRTIFDAFDYTPTMREGTYHRAEDDARTQALHVIEALNG